MKKIIFITTLSLISLASCNKDIVKEVNNGKAIDFKAALETKGNEVTTNNLDNFFVTALTESGNIYFENECFSKSGDGFFSSDKEYYWPASEGLNFFAYHPNNASIGSATVTINSEAKTIAGFTPSSEISNQVDLVIAKGSGNKAGNESTGVFMKFYHQLSQVEIRAKNENTGLVYRVMGMKIMNVASKGDLDFSVTTSWTADMNAKTNYHVTYDVARTLGSESISLMPDEDDNAMLIPQSTTGWDIENEKTTNASKGSYIGIYMQISTSDGSRVFPSDGEYGWIAYPKGFEWEPGYKYIYTLNFTDGAGYVDPEKTEDPENPDDPYKPGDSILGGMMTFDAEINGWKSQSGTINAGNQ